MRKLYFRRFAALLAAAALFMGIGADKAYGATVFYETTERYHISRGISYETCRMVTDSGFLDVYVMKVPLDDPYISISPVESKVEYGYKETASKILEDNNAIAGINGDFFGMSGKFSIPLGIQMANGIITSAGTYANANSNESAGLFITGDGTPFIEYLKIGITFLNGGKKTFNVASINKTADAAYPVCFTTDAISNTKALDDRIPNTAKIVVRNNVITYISKKGENVDVPADGYIILLNSADADKYLQSIAVGQTAELTVTPSFDLSSVEAAIGGAGQLLKNGKIANDTGFISSGRAPRTAVGYTEDRKTLILMVVDGRSHSIGATHAEMAELMLKYGAYEAMHLDGGGSSTMAVTPFGADELKVLNNPSDGSQRKIINALGVFMNAPVGEIKQIAVQPERDTVIKGHSVSLDIFGVDEYYNRIELDPELVYIYTEDGSGTRFENEFFPNRLGKIEIVVTYNKQFQKRATIYCDKVAILKPAVSKINCGVNGMDSLSFTGTGQGGGAIKIDPELVGYEVFPKELGIVEGGVFYAKALGRGYIRCFIGSGMDVTECYIKVDSTLVPSALDSLNGLYKTEFMGYPATISGTAEYMKYGASDSSVGLKLSYNFAKSDETQAAYANFTNPIIIPDNSAGLRLSVYGDGSLNWLRGRLTDANGVGYNIDFARVVDFTGWKDVDAVLPSNMKYPVKLDRLYIVSLSQTMESYGTVYFDNLRYLYNKDLGIPEAETPSDTVYKDSRNVEFYGAPTGKAYDVTIMGALGYTGSAEPADYAQSKQTALTAYAKYSAGGLYFGSAEIGKEIGLPVFSNTGSYRPVGISGLYAIQLNTVNYGLFNSNKAQWTQIKAALAAAFSDYIVIQTDASPLRFKEKHEYQLFHDLLVQEATKNGRIIFVVSCDSGEQNTVSVVDGIRYINLGRLYNNNTLNKDFSVLRFRIEGDDIKYSFEKVF